MSSLVTPTETVRLPSPRTQHDSLHAVGAALRRRGHESRLDADLLCGDLDVRLRVGGSGAACVELLGPCGGVPLGACWQAVRVTPEERIVWCGPPRSCSADEVARFVEDLLQQDDGELTTRYTHLG